MAADASASRRCPPRTLLTVIEIVLLVSVVAHMWAAISLWRQAKRARPQAYVTKKSVVQTYASRTMRWGGVIIALFIVYHILDLTFGVANPDGTDSTPYDRLVASFQNPVATIVYVVDADPAGHAPAPRDLERHADPRPEQPAPRAVGQRLRDRVRRPCSSPATWWFPPPSSSGSWTKDRNALLMPLDLFTVGEPIADTKAPTDVAIGERWSERKFRGRLVNPANRRKLTIIVVGTGLAGGSAAATLGEAGYNVKSFCYQDSPRRAHIVAAQGGINAAKNYRNDGDSVHRLFYDTVKGGDFRSRESNVYRLAEVSVNIIDQCVAQGVPFAREYGGLLDNRSFGGAQVSRTFYARGQTGQQLLSAPTRRWSGRSRPAPSRCTPARDARPDRRRRPGPRHRRPRPGHRRDRAPHFADAVVLATGGYGNVFYLSTNAKGCNVTAIWRAHRKGAYFANPCYTQIHPTCIPVIGRLPVEAHADERVAAQRRPGLGAQGRASDNRDPRRDPRGRARLLPGADLPVVRQPGAPRHRLPRGQERLRRGPRRRPRRARASTSTSPTRSSGWAARPSRPSTATSSTCTPGSPARTRTRSPMRIYPAVHYTMGGLWVDYDLQSTIPGLFVTGEANFSDHGANRLGASALMQGLADGYFVLPNTIRDYLADGPFEKIDDDHPAVVEAMPGCPVTRSRSCSPSTAPARRLLPPRARQDHVGVLRHGAHRGGLRKAIDRIPELRARVLAQRQGARHGRRLNQTLEKAGRVADFFELGELMCIDALHRRESPAAATSAPSSQTDDGEALRDDEQFAYVAAWEWTPANEPPVLHKEALEFEYVHLAQRSYK